VLVMRGRVVDLDESLGDTNEAGLRDWRRKAVCFFYLISLSPWDLSV